MPAIYHTLLISLGVILAYTWLHIPFLEHYSLQVFSLTVLIYFIIKRFKKAKIWHVVPTMGSSEMLVVTFALLLLVGATGNLDSIFYPLTFIHLFFLVLSSRTSTAIVITVEILLFHYALSPQFTSVEVSALMTVPIVMIFFIFAKNQYHEAWKERLIIEQEEKELATTKKDETQLRVFLERLVEDKITQLEELLQQPEQNIQAIHEQLTAISSQAQAVLANTENKPQEEDDDLESIVEDSLEQIDLNDD